MHQFYCILKNCDEPPTPDEIAITSGKKQPDEHAEAEYIRKLEKSSENIKKAFEDQQAHAAVSNVIFSNILMLRSDGQGPWDQEKFKRLLTEWIVACDQPFNEVKKPEFVNMMNFTHHSGGPLNILKRDGIKQCVVKMGKKTIEGLREMFSVSVILFSSYHVSIHRAEARGEGLLVTQCMDIKKSVRVFGDCCTLRDQ